MLNNIANYKLTAR